MLCVTRRNSIAERTHRDGLARLDDDQPIAGVDAVLGEFRFHEREREFRSVDRPGDPIDDVRHRADVIFVAVREHERGDAPAVRVEHAEIRNHEIHAEERGLGEHDAGINEHRRLATDDEQHVHAEFAKPAERDDIHGRRRRRVLQPGSDNEYTPTRTRRPCQTLVVWSCRHLGSAVALHVWLHALRPVGSLGGTRNWARKPKKL